MKPITKELITEIHSALDKGLTKGLGNPVEGEMCIEALICFKLGLPHSDSPPCVGSEVRLAKIALNDCDWSSNHARAEGMRKLAIAQLGSDKIDQCEFEELLRLKSTQRILPCLIQKNYDDLKVKDEKLIEYKKRFESLKELDDALFDEFYNYNCNCKIHYYEPYYYNYYYYNYKNYHKYNYRFYKYFGFGDKFLLLIADTILQTLIELKSEGCQYL